ncbi:hypothetical protein J6590_049261 [Homalodisca vitripennis]|nr:hypothetical protein J6590_049261 [Homalodisca vitripennis]
MPLTNVTFTCQMRCMVRLTSHLLEITSEIHFTTTVTVIRGEWTSGNKGIHICPVPNNFYKMVPMGFTRGQIEITPTPCLERIVHYIVIKRTLRDKSYFVQLLQARGKLLIERLRDRQRTGDAVLNQLGHHMISSDAKFNCFGQLGAIT